MTPQVPEYLVTFEAGIRPLVTAIALGLIWMGATRMEGPAQSRYATAGALSVVLVAWLTVAQYLGSANTYFATRENAVPTVLFGLLIPLMTAAVGLRLSGSFASLLSAIPLHWIVAAQVYRIGGGIFLVLWADGRLPWQFALPAGIGDVMTGCFAFVVAVLLAQKAPGALKTFESKQTPRYRDARKTRSRPACSALDGPDFHWQAHSSFPIAPRTRLLPLIGFLRVNYRLEKEGPFDPGEMILSGSIP